MNTNSNSFQDTLNPICSCGFDVESTSHYVPHCPMYNDERYPPEHYKSVDCRLLLVTETVLIKMLLFGNYSVDADINRQILNATAKCIMINKRFDKSLFHS